MVTESEHASATADAQRQTFDEVEADIGKAALPPFGLPALNHAAIHELGCRIVAKALERNDGSSVGFE